MDTTTARTIHIKDGQIISTGETVTLPAGMDVDIPTWQIIEGYGTYDATVRVCGREAIEVCVSRDDLDPRESLATA